MLIRPYETRDWEAIQAIHDEARKIELRLAGLDAAFLLVWLAAALFRGCFLVRVLRELLCRPEELEKGVSE